MSMKKILNNVIGITVLAIIILFMLIFIFPYFNINLNSANLAYAFGTIFVVNNLAWWWKIATRDSSNIQNTGVLPKKV